MKAVIFARGLGTRLSEETVSRPKPMVEIGDMPILWHIMKIYSSHGIDEFIICCGYKGYMIKEYFANYFLHQSDITFNFQDDEIEVHDKRTESWKVTLVDTGEDTQTGGRLLRVAKFLSDNEDFCLTYGDGVGDINIQKLIEFHKSHGKLATLTAAKPPARFGALEIKDHIVTRFLEKPDGDGGFVNAGFFVLNPQVIDLIEEKFLILTLKFLMELFLMEPNLLLKMNLTGGNNP